MTSIISDAERQQILFRIISEHTKQGWEIQSQSEFSVVLVKKPNHIVHLLLSILTAGFWIIIWLLVALSANKNKAITVGKYGNVTTH